MSRPTGGSLTTAGFTNTSGSKYAKTVGTATATVDITGTATSGVLSIMPTVPGSAMAVADWNSHLATLGALGVDISKIESPYGLVSYSQTV